MIRVTVELIPYGEKSRAEVIAQAEIVNLLTNPERPIMGDYLASFDYRDGLPARYVTLKHHARNQHVWFLIKRCLDELLKCDP